MARTVVNIAVNIKTGDITLPDHTKGNVDSNIGPINYYILRHPEILTENNRTKPTESPKPTQTGDATSGAPGAGKMVAGGWVISTIAALAAAVAIAV